MNTHIYEQFNNTDIITSLKRIVICNIIGLPALLPMLIISKNSSYWVLIVFRIWLAPTLCFIYLFGISKYIAIKLGLANTKIKNDSKIR
jgi:hypothetical protein